MSEDTFLSDDFLRQLISVGDVDVIVGVPSFNDVNSVAAVVKAVEEGVLRAYRRERLVLLNVDGGSRDGTPEALLQASSLAKDDGRTIESLRTLRWITTTVAGDNAPGNMLRAILAAVDLLHAKGCAVISASSENATSAWVDTLLNPVYRDRCDFVAPLYSRHKYDGLLTRNLLYPVTRALFRKPIRELRANEFAFSGAVAAHCLAQEAWRNEAVRGGAEMWMAMHAMANSYRCCQTHLGPKPRAGGGPGVVNLIRNTLGGFFWCLEATQSAWLKDPAPDEHELGTIGPDHQLTNEAVRIDRKRFLEMFRSGVSELAEILRVILDADTGAELKRLISSSDSGFRLSNALWARISYECAAAYHHSVMNREHLVQAMIPIYRGRVYSFLAQHRTSSADAMEADLEDLCREFANQRAFFVERWKKKQEGAP